MTIALAPLASASIAAVSPDETGGKKAPSKRTAHARADRQLHPEPR